MQNLILIPSPVYQKQSVLMSLMLTWFHIIQLKIKFLLIWFSFKMLAYIRPNTVDFLFIIQFLVDKLYPRNGYTSFTKLISVYSVRTVNSMDLVL